MEISFSRIKLGLLQVSLSFSLMTSTVGCAKYPYTRIDPAEASNRVVFAMNESLDKAIAKPTAKLYRRATPWQVRQGIGNFFHNLSELPTLANDLLQGEYTQASTTSGRFVINTTVGLGGIFDVATQKGLPRHTQDFGITLAKWGIPESAYLVIPLLGPSTVRDTLGWGVDALFTPYPYISSSALGWSMFGLNAVQRRAELLEADSIIQSATLDPYTFQRDAYLQHRKYLIEHGGSVNETNANDPYVDGDDDSVEFDANAVMLDILGEDAKTANLHPQSRSSVK